MFKMLFDFIFLNLFVIKFFYERCSKLRGYKASRHTKGWD